MATTNSTTANGHVSTDDGAKQAAPVPMPPGLRHADDSKPGYTRKREKDGFAYFDVEGKRIEDEAEIQRINSLAIPPAYEDVWICPDPRGHIQATGRDTRGRKQYRYHPHWRETRDADKYERMAQFGRALPRIRARVARDLELPGMPCDKVMAAVVRLLDTTLVRIGSVEYARENQSYGLTTLRKKHVKVEAGQLRFKFRGKSGIEHDVTVDDPRVKRIVRRCAELPGHDLFQYLDDDGTRRTVGSADINDYLRRASGADFTAKDYRTWAGSVYALATLRRLVCGSAAEARRHIVATVKEVAGLLRNTPAVCRRCYIHPAVISAFEADQLQSLPPGQSKRGLKVDEVAFAALLAHAEKRAAKLARQAGAKGRKLREAQAADSINGSISTLLQKSRAIRKEANKAALQAAGKSRERTGDKGGRKAREKAAGNVAAKADVKADVKAGARAARRAASAPARSTVSADKPSAN